MLDFFDLPLQMHDNKLKVSNVSGLFHASMIPQSAIKNVEHVIGYIEKRVIPTQLNKYENFID